VLKSINSIGDITVIRIIRYSRRSTS